MAPRNFSSTGPIPTPACRGSAATSSIRKARVPWGRPGGVFTLLLEVLLMTMVSAMPVTSWQRWWACTARGRIATWNQARVRSDASPTFIAKSCCFTRFPGCERPLAVGAVRTADHAEATCRTIRLKRLKLGALERVSVWRIKIAMASACPWQDEFELATCQTTQRYRLIRARQAVTLLVPLDAETCHCTRAAVRVWLAGVLNRPSHMQPQRLARGVRARVHEKTGKAEIRRTIEDVHDTSRRKAIGRRRHSRR
jgi:hypothetical protein